MITAVDGLVKGWKGGSSETMFDMKKVLNSLDDELHKACMLKDVESGWYLWWEKGKFLRATLH